MKHFSFILLCFCLSISNSFAQKHYKPFNFKKDAVIDIILLTAAPNSNPGFEQYKKTAFPVTFKYSYTPQPGFKIK